MRAIAEILTLLVQAYPDRHVDQDTLLLYFDSLSDIPLALLEQAARQHIRTSPWFPKIAELRQIAASLARLPRDAPDMRAVLPPDHRDPLLARALELEDAYTYRGELDISKWQQLIQEFERANRPHRAEGTRQRLERLQAAERGEVDQRSESEWLGGEKFQPPYLRKYTRPRYLLWQAILPKTRFVPYHPPKDK